MVFGSMPNDGGHLLLSETDRQTLLLAEPNAEKWLRPFLGAEEFINGIARWCLWLKDIQPNELKALPHIAQRVEAVKQHRLSSTRASTRKLASTPRLFGEDRQPDSGYLLVPRVSSENRAFIPIGFMSTNTVASDASLTVPNATLYHFGILCSTMHNAWMRAVCGRMKSDYRYSAGIVYNNFPWPENATHPVSPDSVRPELVEGQRADHTSTNTAPTGKAEQLKINIETAAQAILDARANHPHSTLATLYHPNTMPDDLRAAHQALDKAVDAAYLADGGQKKWKTDSQRVAFLFRRYEALTSVLAGR